MFYYTKLITAVTACCLAVPSFAQELFTHSQFEENMAKLGQHPSDLGMEVVRMCRIYGVSKTNAPNQFTAFSPCDGAKQAVLEIQKQSLIVSEPNHEWNLQSSYHWLPLANTFVGSRVSAQAVVTIPAINVDGVMYELPNDRASLTAWDQCQWLSIQDTGYKTRKPGCSTE
jgi:hypothetical protein